MAQTGEDMATAIFDIVHQCLDSFERIAAKEDELILTRPFVPGDGTDSSKSRSHSLRDFLGLRNSFSFWIDYTGALSLMDCSLDTRLRGLSDISSMVIELLEMVLRNLQRLDRNAGDSSMGSLDPTSDSKELQVVISRWEDASRAIDSALDRLHFLAAAIRKASAKQLEYNVATFLTDDDIVFRRDAASLVRWKFPSARKGLCEQLGDSIAVRRRMLLHKHRHAKKLTVRRVVETAPSAKENHGPEPKSKPTASPPAKDRIVRHLDGPASGVTKASVLDPQAPMLRHLHLPKRPALTTVISTASIAPGDSFEYPPPPKTNEGETRIQCPYCLMPLDLGELENKGNEYWRHHVDEDLKPYVCLFPECAEALVFFIRRHEWKSHMESVHSIDWPRKVHSIIWYCDIDHDPPKRFETEVQWRKHMKNLNSHPKRQLTEPTKAQLNALSPRKQQVALRERFVCPLCEQIPEKVRPLAEKAKGNLPDMYEFLVDHVANHIKSLSLMSLPCLDDTPAPLDTDGESIAIKDSFRRLRNQGSVPQPPSGIEYLDGVSLPPEVWSTLDRENLAALTRSVPEWAWDEEYPDYVHPDDPPESLDDEWVEMWKIWKEESDPSTQESVDLDPVIAHLKARASTLVEGEREKSESEDVSGANSKRDAERNLQSNIEIASDYMDTIVSGYRQNSALPCVATAGFSHLRKYGFFELHDGGNEQLNRYIWENGLHDRLDPKLIKIRGMADAMRAALKSAEVPDITRKNEFVPLDRFCKIINKTTILQLLNELKSCKKMSTSQKEQLANNICSVPTHHSYRRVVATLIRIKKEEDIPQIVKEGFMDDCLPLRLTGTQLHHRRTGSMCRSMSEWGEGKRRKFWKVSPNFSCPVFMRSEGKVFHYILHEPVRLPFEEEARARKKRDSNASSSSGNGGGQDTGGFSSVARVKIHASHHSFGNYGPRLEDNVFAVKTLYTKDETVFEKEVTVLLRFAHRKDKQLVKLLATYEIRNGDDVTYHLIFPWAECNMRSLWSQLPTADPTKASRIHLITKEVAAIAASLAYLHNEYARDLDPSQQEQFGRHGDIKAENLLVYRARSSGAGQHVVFVADFGLSRFHRQHSRSKVNPNATSPSYRPPEFDLPNGTLSRKSDIWSLGAFYLEHITWHLEGWKAVETDFPDFREDEDHEHIVSDIFFKIVMDGNSRIAMIKPQVTQWIDLLHQHPCATQYIHDLLDLVEYHMLVVDRESRIDASTLKEQLQDMYQRCMLDTNYCMLGLPRRHQAPFQPIRSFVASAGWRN